MSSIHKRKRLVKESKTKLLEAQRKKPILKAIEDLKMKAELARKHRQELVRSYAKFLFNVFEPRTIFLGNPF